MRSCSVTKKLQIARGNLEDYKKLAHYHYRDSKLGPYAAIFTLKPAERFAARLRTDVAGVVVYTMPTPGSELRNIATGNLFAGLGRQSRLALINKNIRRISRVIIEPRFRGLGLASRLVRETLVKTNVLIIEAMAVMGLVNPFFEKAGMKAYTAKMPSRCIQLIEAFSTAGIEKDQLINAQKTQQKLDALKRNKAEFIEYQIRKFLQSYGKRTNMKPSLERTRFVLSKLTFRPVYYIWLNENLELRI